MWTEEMKKFLIIDLKSTYELRYQDRLFTAPDKCFTELAELGKLTVTTH